MALAILAPSALRAGGRPCGHLVGDRTIPSLDLFCQVSWCRIAISLKYGAERRKAKGRPQRRDLQVV